MWCESTCLEAQPWRRLGTSCLAPPELRFVSSFHRVPVRWREIRESENVGARSS